MKSIIIRSRNKEMLDVINKLNYKNQVGIPRNLRESDVRRALRFKEDIFSVRGGKISKRKPVKILTYNRF